MAFTFALMSPKGGVGKTTTAVILASQITQLGKSVTLIEADPNGHLQRWAEQGRLPETVRVVFDGDPEGDTLPGHIEQAAQESDYIVIDTEGTHNDRAFIAAHTADLVVIPMQFSSMDLAGATAAMGRLDRIEQDGGAPIFRAILPTKVNQAIRPASQVQTELALSAAGIPVLSPGIVEKDAYRLMLANGCLLQDLPLYTKVANIQPAIDNIQAVLDALAEFYATAINAQLESEASHG